MSAVPLTLEALPLNTSTEIKTPYQTNADVNNKMERPTNLTLEESQQESQHLNATPALLTSATATTAATFTGNISPALSSTSSLSPSFLPEMPQWKRDLIQRRKQNVQRTISASSPSTTTTAAALSLTSPTAILGAGVLYGGLKTSTSLSSVCSLAGSNTNIDQLASDGLLQQYKLTKDYTTLNENKQQNAVTSTTTATAIPTHTLANTTKPATIKFIKSSTPSPLKEKAEKFFGGQYTATTFSSTTTKEEIFTQYHHQQKQKQSQQKNLLKKSEEEEEEKEYLIEMAENQSNKYHQELEGKVEEETYEIFKKTKEEHKEKCEVEEAEHETTTINTTSSSIITNKQQQQTHHQMATRLTGSSYNTHTTTNTSTSSSTSLLKRASTIEIGERENLQNHFSGTSIIGANVNFVNQSLNKCESERLVCTANTTTTFNTSNIISNTGNSNNCLNNSITIGVTSNSSSGGGINNSNSSYNSGVNVGNVVKISQKLQENQFIKNEQQQLQQQQKKLIRFQKQNINLTRGGGGGLDLKSPTKCFLTTSTSSLSLAAVSSSSTSTANKKKMVAVQEMKKSTQNSATHLHPITTTCNAQQQQQQTNRANNRGIVGVGSGVVVSNNANTNSTDLDSSEDLSYGPGIVSKLRCRYLSLALRETMEQQRLNKEHLRRSTSLNNLLDNTEDDEEEDEEEEEEENLVVEEMEQQQNNEQQNSTSDHYYQQQLNKKTSGILKSSLNHSQEKRFSHNSQGSNGVGVTFTETSSYNKRSRHLKRGNDSLKRARSVEALLSEKSPWQVRNISSAPTCVTIEDKIHNARERLHLGTDHMPPKRLTSIIDDTERPPPDLVKQTLKLFEATANRRPRLNNRSNSKGDVASKVETFKNIIKEQKPVVNYPKPISPTKKLQKPSKTSTPQANDLLQSPLGRKVMAATLNTPNFSNNDFTPIKSSNSANALSEHTPDIIPRQTQNKFNTATEKDFKQINKEKLVESNKEKFEVDSPLTALTKELSKMKLNDSNNTTPIKKTDYSAKIGSSSSSSFSSSVNRESESVNEGGGGGGGEAGDNNDDACQRHNNKYTHNEENIKTLQQAENDKIINSKTKQINSETILSSTPTSTSSTITPTPPTTTTIDNKNEATTVNNYDFSLVKTEMASPPPSSSDLSDGNENDDQDEYAGVSQTNTTATTTKRITRTALDNIAKAGSTQQFKFNNSSLVTSSQNSSSNSPLNAGKQIGVIRPLLNTTNTAQTKSLETMETLKHTHTTSSSPLTSREIEKNRINDLKKSSQITTSSPTSASLDNVIKTTTPANASPVAVGASGTSSGFADVDTVISATNSPLWAMRKRRQTPPAAPVENTTMVFNFSNRKEVPDYIESDGVIFRRKRELPKPNESGFVLLGDLSVETSTDMDYDDFSMCPPSPCDVEFVNANIVIDGKSSIRQKSKDATHYRVQFNDTLTSTFEYPSEASLCVDESFSAYNESYSQPHDSNVMANDFSQAFQSLCLENSSMPQQHHHVADEIIQLPTLNASTPASNSSPLNTSNMGGGGGASTTPTKNILGNLPLDYPVLEKGTPLTNTTTNIETTTTLEKISATAKTQDNSEQTTQLKKKSRKDLKLPLIQQHQQQETKTLLKPPLPVKRFQVINSSAATVKSINSPGTLKSYEDIQQNNEETLKNLANNNTCKEEIFEYKPKLRKTPRVLSKPQYACFLQSTTEDIKYPIQRSRSNEFQKTVSSTLSVTTAQVARSNSLRNFNNYPLKRTPNSTTNAAHALYFSAEVNPTNICNEISIPNEVNAIEKSLKAATSPEPLNVLNNLQTELNENSLSQTEISNDFVASCLNNLAETNSKASLKSQSHLSSLPNSQDSQRKPTNFANIELKSQSLNDLVCETVSFETNTDIFLPDNKTSLSDVKAKSLENVSFSENIRQCIRKPEENLKPFTNLKNSCNLLGIPHDQTVEVLPDLRENHKKKQNPLNFSTNLVDSNNLWQIAENNSKVKLTALSENLLEAAKDNTTANSERAFDKNEATNKDFKEQINENSVKNEKYSKSLTNLNEINFKIDSELIDTVVESGDLLNLTVNSDNSEVKLGKLTENNPIKPKVFPKKEYKAPRTLSLTINTDYITGYSSKVIHKPKKQSEVHPPAEQSLSLCVNNDDIMYSTDKIRQNVTKTQSKSEENLCSPEKLLVKMENSKKSISCENVSDAIEYSLHRNYIEKQKPETLSKTGNSNVFTTLKIPDNLESLLMNSKETPSSAAVCKSINLSQVNKSLQMSLDSLDDYEDALANPIQVLVNTVKEVNACDMEASDILDDIAVGIDTESMFDFKNLLNLKKSQIEYYLKNLHKYRDASLDSSSSPQDENETFQSACNTLESKASLKPYRAVETASQTWANVKEEDGTSKNPKTLRVRTTEKIINFTNIASQNVSSYNTFRKSKNFYKNASKSFKNSLKFYENFSEKSSQTSFRSPVKRSISLTEKSRRTAGSNRRIFSKSCRLSRNKADHNPDSPTENSYSFEYFDAESDRNGNLLNRATVLIEYDLSPKDETDGTLSITEENALSLGGATNLSPKPANIHTSPKEYYFNNSPRPFKRLYEATTMINTRNEDILSGKFSVKPIDQNLNTLPYKGPISFANSTLYIKPFKKCKEISSDSENFGSISTAQGNIFENTDRLTPQHITLRSNSFSVVDSIKFNNYSSESLQKMGSPENMSKLDAPKRGISISASQISCVNSLSLEKCKTTNSSSQLNSTYPVENSQNSFSQKETFQNHCYNSKLDGLRNTTSNFQLDTLGSENSESLTKNSVSGSSKLDSLKVSSSNASYFGDAFDSPLNNSNITPKIFTNTKHLELKTQLNTTTTPKTTTTQTLAVKALNKNTTITPTTFTTIDTITTSTTTTTNVPTTVAVLKNSKFKNVSYRNSSFSSTVSHKTSAGLCTTSTPASTTINKSLITAKYHHNQKANNPPPPPLKKYTTAHTSSKILPRRVTAMTSTNSTTTTATTYTSTSTSTSTTTSYSSTTSNSRLKNSTCTSGNIIVTPLRRRIPGNTLYYV